jgi:hypothetical protein
MKRNSSFLISRAQRRFSRRSTKEKLWPITNYCQRREMAIGIVFAATSMNQ